MFEFNTGPPKKTLWVPTMLAGSSKLAGSPPTPSRRILPPRSCRERIILLQQSLWWQPYHARPEIVVNTFHGHFEQYHQLLYHSFSVTRQSFKGTLLPSHKQSCTTGSAIEPIMALSIETNLTMSPRITHASPKRHSVPSTTVDIQTVFLVESSPPPSETTLEDTDNVSTTAIKSPTTVHASSLSVSSHGKAQPNSRLERATNTLKRSKGLVLTKKLVRSARLRLRRLVHKLIKAPRYIDASLDGVSSVTLLTRASPGIPEKVLSFSSDETVMKFSTTCSPVDMLRVDCASNEQSCWSLPTLVSSPSPIMQLHNIMDESATCESLCDVEGPKSRLATGRFGR